MVLSNKKLKQKLREALAEKAASAVGTPITQTKTTTDGAKVPAKALPLNSKEVNGETSEIYRDSWILQQRDGNRCPKGKREEN